MPFGIAQLRKGLVFGQDVNVARCAPDGSQIMLNGQGRADPKKIARQVADGCSVQVVHPQRFSTPVAELLKRLEAHFGCLWGANSFRTPPGSMGFKAHHDEVEVFMLQLEGAKRWRLHRCPKGPLPRSYCWDYKEEELGPPLMELVLEAGDLLYLPRGTVHKEELARTSAPIRDGTLILLDSDSTNTQVQNALVSLSLHNKAEENLVTPEHSTHVGGI
eukprot:s473_g8.t1